METNLITENVWKELTSTVSISKKRSYVAVAYFGQDGAKMLPLSKGSILVVDASENAVKMGQTCPSELLKLYYKGVKIYSKPNLHSKIFVIDNSLYIGSPNVSIHSSNNLIETIFQTSEKKSILSANKFIKSLCDIELGSDLLEKLNAIYRPPKNVIELPNKHIYTYHLDYMDYSDDEQRESKIGKTEAMSKRINQSRHYIDEFMWQGSFPPQINDIILQIVKDGNKKYIVPPGILIHTKKYKKRIFCYLEVPVKYRKQIKWLEEQLNSSEKKELIKDGKRTKEFAEKIISIYK